MKFNTTIIGVGILAGLASALLSSGIVAQSALTMVLYFLTPLPILVAALGWGSGAGVVAAIIATLAIAFTASPMGAVLVALMSFIPAATAAYLCGLARPAQEVGGPSDIMIWYPLPDIMLRVALMLAFAFVVIGMMIGFGQEMAQELARELVSRLAEADPQFADNEEFRATLTTMLLVGMPAMQPAIALAALMGNLYLALRLTALSGRLRRGRDDWPSMLRMPRIALPFFAVVLALAFLDGDIGMVATVFAGALATGFLLSGFAVFHLRTRGKVWRPVALWLAYFAILFISPLLFVFLVMGLLDTSRTAPITSRNPGA